MDIKSEMLEGLSEEIREKVGSCGGPEDLIALATSQGIDLTDEQVDMISGGDFDWSMFSDEACESYASAFD